MHTSMVLGSISTEGKFEGIDNSLTVSHNSVYGSACMLKSNVLGQNGQI